MGPEAVARRVAAGLLACCCIALSCSRTAREVKGIWTIDPAAPVTGTLTLVRLTLRTDDQPLAGATLQLEAHMSHPGMAPVTTRMHERAAGTYEGTLNLTMAGAWALVASGELADGTRITRNIEVAAVQPSR